MYFSVQVFLILLDHFLSGNRYFLIANLVKTFVIFNRVNLYLKFVESHFLKVEDL